MLFLNAINVTPGKCKSNSLFNLQQLKHLNVSRRAEITSCFARDAHYLALTRGKEKDKTTAVCQLCLFSDSVRNFSLELILID